MIRFGQYPRTGFDFEIEPEYCRSAIYIMGSPNMGKSTLLGNLAEQFCAAGEGVLLLDIKGDLAQEVASRTKHPECVVYVKLGTINFPGNEARMWTFNPFEGHRASQAARDQIFRSVYESFERIGLARFDSMANIRATLRTAINIALTLDDPTYLDLFLIVVDEAYRTHLRETRKHIDHISRRHWQDLDNPSITTRTARRTEINTTRTRLETLLDGPNFNLPTGQYHSTLRLKEWLDEGKMVLIDLGLPLEHQTGVDLGNLIMAQLTAETFLRPEGQRQRTWRVMVDEFHLFVGDTFAEIIRFARTFNVLPVVAHQDRGQFRPNDEGDYPLKGAVGHAGITINLHPSLEDRPILRTLYGEEKAQELVELKQHRGIIDYFSSLADRYTSEPIKLCNWWADPVPGQLAQLQMAAYPHTKPRAELVEHNRKRYWDHLDGTPKRDTRNSNVPSKPKPQTSPPPQVRPRPPAGQTGQSGEPAGPSPSHARPGVARPPRAVDQRDAARPHLPRPPRTKPGTEE